MAGYSNEHAAEGLALAREVIARLDPGALSARAWPTGMDSCAEWTVVGFGKASLAMTGAALDRLGERAIGGVVVGPAGREGEAGRLALRWPRMRVHVADHPFATERNVRAAERVLACVQEGRESDGLLVLISGGGSAHLTLPSEGVGLGELVDLSRELMRSGATIGELNCVRKHLERLKGGRMAEAARGFGRAVVLVLSDVMGDDLGTIASGPMTADETTYDDAIEVLTRRGIEERVAPGAWKHLRAGVEREHPETPKPGDEVFATVEHRIIGGNADAVHAAVEGLARRGFRVVERRDCLTGEASEVGISLARRATEGAMTRDDACAIVWGGETTVTVGEGAGRGGRCQEIGLAAARELAGEDDGERVSVLAFGTDGVDGPTNAAGASVIGGRRGTWRSMINRGVDVERAIREHDSHAALDAAGCLLRTGPTGTNVNDVMVAMVRAR